MTCVLIERGRSPGPKKGKWKPLYDNLITAVLNGKTQREASSLCGINENHLSKLMRWPVFTEELHRRRALKVKESDLQPQFNSTPPAQGDIYERVQVKVAEMNIADGHYRQLAREYVSGAYTRKKTQEFSLTGLRFVELVSSPCHYCNRPPSRSAHGILCSGVDRKDNTVGYTSENCLPSCSVCNYAKGRLSYELYISLCNAVALQHPKRATDPVESSGAGARYLQT